MENLNEAVIKLINEDVIGGKKLLEQELYNRLGIMLEEKLKDFAPTIFNEAAKKAAKDYDGDGKVESGTEEWKGSRDKAIKKNMAMKENEELDEEVLTEDYEELVNELQSLVEEIEKETGEELNESEIEELASILLEELDPNEEETEEEDEEDFEEDFEEETQE